MNIMRFKFLSLLMSVTLLVTVVSCNEDEPPLPANTATFGTSELGFPDEDTEATVTINFTRAASEDKNLVVSFVPTGVTYGEEFTTSPASTSNTFTLTIPAGETQTNFVVTKSEGIFLEGDESILFTISSAEEPFVLKDNITVKLTFSQIVSAGGTLQLQGLIASEAGSSAGNSVFVDLSANLQTPVARNSWDLGFYSGDDFRLILNNATAASAVMVNKTDLSQVTAEDVNADDLAIGFASGSFSAFDNINGALDHTAISEVSATDADNKVWVINRVGGAGATQAATEWYKIRVLRNGTGYTLQYAQVDATTFTTVTIEKNPTLNFSYFHFVNGGVTVEPAKTNWDFQWGWSIYYTTFEGEKVPYAFSDLVFINHHNGVKMDTVFTADVTYAAFSEANLANYDLESVRDGIGSGWRVTSPGAEPVGVRSNRFYLIEDSQGNIYKLKFVNFHANDGGTRGKPNIEYALVKKADD